MNNLLQKRFSEKSMGLIARCLLELATNRAVQSEVADAGRHAKIFLSELEKGDPESIESALLNLYVHLHAAGSRYSPSEKELLYKRCGYSCYPGGLSPIIMAGQFIKPDSIVADLGAGNGLQGLLLQRLYPHCRTLQIELSFEMIRIGKIFQKALGISDDRVAWIHDDIVNVSIEKADFVYIYRPAKPLNSGKKLYRAIAEKLASTNKPLVIFSVADCLARFLDERFSIFYTDGHLTCFIRNCEVSER
ncbi:MAG: hypothetical protein AB1638_11815 [Nitrospirota bacterium]